MPDWKLFYSSGDFGIHREWGADDARLEAQDDLADARLVASSDWPDWVDEIQWGLLLPLEVTVEGDDADYSLTEPTIDPAAFWAALQEHAPEVAKALADAAPRSNPRTEAEAWSRGYREGVDYACKKLVAAAATRSDSPWLTIRENGHPPEGSCVQWETGPHYGVIENYGTDLHATLYGGAEWEGPGSSKQRYRILRSGPGDAAPRAGVTAVYPHKVRVVAGNLCTDSYNHVFNDASAWLWQKRLCDQLDTDKCYHHLHITLEEAE